MKRENGVRGDIKIARAMFAAPTFARSKKVGFVANAAMQTADITNVVRIAPAMGF